MENGDETFASPTAAADFDDFAQGLTNGNTTKAAPEYDVGEMDALRDAKRDLEEKLAAAGHENGFLSKEAARLEAQVARAHEDTAAADRAAADAEAQAAGLRDQVKRLQDLLAAADASDRSADGPGGLGGVLATAHQEKLALQEQIEALKAAAAADADEEEEEEEGSDAPATKAGPLASHGMVAAAAAAGAAATAAVAAVVLSRKR